MAAGEDSLAEVIKTVIATLKADSAVAAIVGDKVYSHVPQDKIEPFLEVANQTTYVPFDTKDSTGDSITLSVDGWSVTETVEEVARLMRTVRQVLNRDDTLSVIGHSLIDIYWEFGQFVKEADGVTWHGHARYRIDTEQKGAYSSGFSDGFE